MTRYADFERWKADVEAGKIPNHWKPGGADEPEWSRRKRQARLPDLPPHVPRVWASVARWWLDEGNQTHEETVARLFASDDLASHWRRLVRETINYQLGTLGRPVWALRHELYGGLRGIIISMIARGGWAPATSPRDLKRHRQAIASSARALASALNADPYAAELSIGGMLQAFDIDMKMDPNSASKLAGTRGVEALRTFANNVEDGAPLDVFSRDEMILADGVYRDQDSERRRLETALQWDLIAITGSAQDAFVADAVTEILAMPTTTQEVGARRRNRAKKNG